MVGQPVCENPMEQVIEQCHPRLCVQIQPILINHGQPVLLLIAQFVDGPQRACLLAGEGQRHFTAQVHTLREANRPLGLLVEYALVPLYQRGLEQHLERVLEM